jgi:Tol biopolymer transport system component/DNA-binding winged helix-turn-helix (wHTH) protein
MNRVASDRPRESIGGWSWYTRAQGADVGLSGSTKRTVRFGVFEVDLCNGELRKHGVRLRLQEQPFKVLAALLEQPGEVVSREELVRRLWPEGTFVDFDRGLNAAVTRLRQVLGDSAVTPRYVETVARRGYRLLPAIEDIGAAAPPPPPPSSSAIRKWIAAVVLAVALLTLAAALSLRRNQLEPGLEQITRDPSLATDPALSRDGRLVAFASNRGGENLNLWVKQLFAGGHAVQLTHDTSDAHQPSFSPDSSTIVYRSEREGGGIYLIPAIGGEAALLVPNGRDPRFSPDGKWIAYWVGAASGVAPDGIASGRIYVIPSSGGEPTMLGSNLPPCGYPVWSPDSTHLLVQANSSGSVSGEDADFWTVSLSGGPARKTGLFQTLKSDGFSLEIGSRPRPSAWVGNTLIFSAQKGDGRSIWQIRVKPGGASVSGPPGRLTLSTALDMHADSIGQGFLIFSSLRRSSAIWSLPLKPNQGKVTGELQKPSISANGKLLVYGTLVSRHEDIWSKNLENGKETPLANTASAEWHPQISRDGAMVAYTVDDGRSHAIYVVPSGGGKATQEASVSGWIFDWSPDRRHLLFHQKSLTEPNLKVLDLGSGVVSDFLAKPGYTLYQSKFSPDGHWLAFEAVAETIRGPGDSRLFLVRVENGVPVPGSEWILVSDEHGWADKPRWSPDGNILYFVSDRDGYLCVWARRLDPATGRPASAPFPICHFHKTQRSLSTGLLEIDVADDKMVLGVGELSGNIWRLGQ